MRTAPSLSLLLCAVISTLSLQANDQPPDGNYLDSFSLAEVKTHDSRQKIPREFWETLRTSKVPSAAAAEELAIQAYAPIFHLRDYDSVRVVGLYRSDMTGGTGVEGLAAPGDWIWRFT